MMTFTNATASWIFLGIVFGAGIIGGLVNAYLTDNGFARPRTEDVNGMTILRPGFWGNAFIGGIAAAVSYGLYGPLSAAPILSNRLAAADSIADRNSTVVQTAPASPQAGLDLTLSTVVGAILVGIGGARVLSSEVDKRLLKAAASTAAVGKSDPHAARNIAIASPAQALEIAKNL
jgi:hypothetical protein